MSLHGFTPGEKRRVKRRKKDAGLEERSGWEGVGGKGGGQERRNEVEESWGREVKVGEGGKKEGRKVKGGGRWRKGGGRREEGEREGRRREEGEGRGREGGRERENESRETYPRVSQASRGKGAIRIPRGEYLSSFKKSSI